MCGDFKMISAYTSMSMTGRFCDEMLVEALMLKRVLNDYSIGILNPVLEEGIPNEHVRLENVPTNTLEHFWKRDKQMIRESDIVIDYMTMNKSDGSNKEVAYNRFCLWKPTIRVWDGAGGLISRIEDDIVVPSLLDAVTLIKERWGTYEKLGQWRKDMLERCYPKWLEYQYSLLKRYGVKEILLCDVLKGE